MTLDEAIKHAEEVAERKEENASWFWDKEGNPNYDNCVRCAEEHRQLAEWLRELKRLREQTEKRTETHACDCISRQAAIDALNDVSENYTGKGKREWYPHLDFMVDAIKAVPSVEPERKPGKWLSAPKGKSICISDEMTDTFLKLPIALCSNCGEVVPVIGKWKRYCPMCGAKMEVNR